MASIELEKLGEEPPPSRSSSTSTMAGGCLCLRRQWAKLMKKIFGRKSKDEEPQADSSFGRNNRPPQNDNPYAQNADPYVNNTQSYGNSQSSLRSSQSGSSTAARPGLPSGLPSGPRPGGGLPRQQPPRLPSYDSAPPQYPGAAKAGSGYSDEKVGNSAGYGTNRYNAGAASFNNQYSATSGPGNGYPSQRPGGYGGLDESPQNSQGSAPPRYSPPKPSDSWGADNGDGYGDQGEMTEEQLEDAQVRDLKRQAHDVRQESKQSLANSKMVARQALETARATRQIYEESEERLGRIEDGADRALDVSNEAQAGASKLDRLNSTPFFIPVGGKKKRQEDANREVRRRQEAEEAKDETRRLNFESDQKVRNAMQGYEKPKLLGAGKADKYTFEDDDGTEAADEDEIADGVDELSGIVGELNFHAHAFSARLDADPDRASRITQKVTRANEKVLRTNARLNTIN